MIPVPQQQGARADLHCHSTASEVSKLGIQRGVGLPECATPPREVYELAKRRGMDFVTITDHDTISGALEIAGEPDVFISEELTAWFRGEPQAVHVLCYGITPDDHEWLQAHSGDVEECAGYLHANGITCALAHPFYPPEAPLTPRHRRRLAELFPIWEVRNGSRARELNMPAAVYIETHGGTGVGGSDDHAGVDIGRTFTQTPPASTPEEFLAQIAAGQAEAMGDQGSAAKWAHSAIALASRALLQPPANPAAPGRGVAPGRAAEEATSVGDLREAARGVLPRETANPDAVLKMVERVLAEADERKGDEQTDIGPREARAFLLAWLDRLGFEGGAREVIDLMQADDFTHSDLARRARGIHERMLRGAVENATNAAEAGSGYGEALRDFFDACLPALPYAAATTFLGKEKGKLAPRDGEPRRVALLVDAIGSMHGVTHTLERIRELGVAGFEVEVIGTDPSVDRRLPAVAEIDVPFYTGLQVGIPSLPALVETLAEGRYDLVHLATPGPTGAAGAIVARIAGLPCVGSHHTELASYAHIRSGDEALQNGMALAMSLFYRQCEVVLSPSLAADRSLESIGIEPGRIARWGRGVDTERFNPGRRDTPPDPETMRVLYAGRLTKEKGTDLVVESFLRARRRHPGLHLMLAGGGPEEERLKRALGIREGESNEQATFLGWLGGTDLARAYANADAFLFCSETDTFGQVILEAQASGLPVIAVRAGGPASLIRGGETGLLCPPDADAIAEALVELATSPVARRRLARNGLLAARANSWEAALAQLGSGYRDALERAAAPEPVAEPQQVLAIEGALRTALADGQAPAAEPAPVGGGARAA